MRRPLNARSNEPKAFVVSNDDERPPVKQKPENLEAEQALLGAILYDNKAIQTVSDFLKPEHFSDDLHAAVYEHAAKLIASGTNATPITLRTFFEKSRPIHTGQSVPQYLVWLFANATTIINARDYGRTIYNLALRRELVTIGHMMADVAYDSPVDFDPSEQIAESAALLARLAAQQHQEIAGLSAQEFLALSLPAPQWIADPLLQQGGICMVYAWRGVGKTWFTMSLADAIGRGAPFLKWQVKQPRGVLYVDGEMPAAGLQERLATLGRPAAGLRILSADRHEQGLPDLSTPAGQALVERVLGNSDVLVLDNLSTLCRSGIENEAESWLPMQEWLLRLRRRGKTTILVHHAGKGGAQRGTSHRETVLDVVLNLRSPEDYNPEEGARFEIRFEKGRGLKGDAVASFEAKMANGPGGELLWTWADLTDTKEAEILELKASGMTVRAIAKQVGISKSAVQRALARCPSVPPQSGGDSRDSDTGPGRKAGQREGRATGNQYAAAKARKF
jgi:hypothetical protein